MSALEISAFLIVLLVLFLVLVWAERPRRTSLLTPGIRAEVTMILGENGQIGIYHTKLAPEDNATEIYGVLLMRWLGMLSGLGVTLNFETESGQVVPLVRPQSETKVNASEP